MAQPFFGRRDAEPSVLRPGTVNHPNAGAAATAHSPSVAGTSSASAAASANSAPTPFVAKEGGSTLTVGPNIKLKGLEITDCDTLVVEGMVEATMDSRLMQISERGSFKGSAEIDVAEVLSEGVTA